MKDSQGNNTPIKSMPNDEAEVTQG